MSTVILDGVDRYRVCEAVFEGVRVVLNYLGEPYSPAYVQGISGAAFRIGGICPCAPTCSCAMDPARLLHLFGYECAPSEPAGDAETANRAVKEWLALAMEEISAGRPVLGWHAFTNAEWDVVCGYDEDARQLVGRGSYVGLDGYAREDWERMARAIEFCPAFGIMRVGEKTGQLDAPAAETAALREAVRHAHDQARVDELGGEKWVFLEGLACYDRWVRAWSDPQKARDIGDAYCLGIYRFTHRAAGGFLREIAPRYPAASTRLTAAAAHFEAEADTLDQCMPLFGWSAPEGPDAGRSARAANLLACARDRYARGIDEVEAAVQAIGGG